MNFKQAIKDYVTPIAGFFCIGIFGASVIMALLNPWYWNTYETIIKTWSYPCLMLGIGLLTGRYVQ